MTQYVSDDDFFLFFVCESDDLPSLCDGLGDGFFDEDVDAGGECLEGKFGVGIGVSADGDGIRLEDF